MRVLWAGGGTTELPARGTGGEMAEKFATTLLDRRIELGTHLRHRMGERNIWPQVAPNAAGEYIATIRAVWADKDGTIEVGCETPEGAFFQTHLSFHTLLPVRH